MIFLYLSNSDTVGLVCPTDFCSAIPVRCKSIANPKGLTLIISRFAKLAIDSLPWFTLPPELASLPAGKSFRRAGCVWDNSKRPAKAF